MKLAAIDIGTNTVLLLIAEVQPTGLITPVVYEQRIPRLGKGVDANRNLHRESMLRVLSVLHEYRTIIGRHEVSSTVVAATSAVRDALNRHQFVEMIRRETQWEVEVLTGEDEAYWTYRGAVSGIPGEHRTLVLDVGGGSTEITIGGADAIEHSTSLSIGSVRLTERYFRHDPPKSTEIDAAIDAIDRELLALRNVETADTVLVAVAGTATSLALLDQRKRDFSIEAVANYRLPIANVEALVDLLRALTSEQIADLSPALAGRSDVIFAGSLITYAVMRHFGFGVLVVSERGVRYGLVVREWERLTKREK